MVNILQEIFIENWEKFKEKYPAYDTEYYSEVVQKMLNCGNLKYGYIEYRCLNCGKSERVIPFSCKSMFCLRCGKIYSDNFTERVGEVLHPGVIYRHLILTIPEKLNVLFYRERHMRHLLDLFFKTGWNFINDMIKVVMRKEVSTGCIMILHIAGRLGNYRPHLHILLISGGIVEESGEWVVLDWIPYEILHKKWQYYVLTMLNEYFGTGEVNELIDKMWKEYPHGFVANIQRGEVPRHSSGLAKYLAKYVSNPTISLRRIKAYDRDKGEVEYVYQSHKTKREETERVNVLTFIGRMVQQILPKGFQRVRYYGLQATKTFEKVKELIVSAMSKVGKVASGCYKVAKKVLYRERYEKSCGRDPLKCGFCGEIMDIWKIWNPKYGVIFDEEKRLKRGIYGTVKEDMHIPSFNVENELRSFLVCEQLLLSEVMV